MKTLFPVVLCLKKSAVNWKELLGKLIVGKTFNYHVI